MNVKQGDRLYRKNRSELINEITEEKGYIHCMDCGTSVSFKFHCHHIIFRSEKPGHKHLHDKQNLLIVCNACHERYHDDKGYRNMIVDNRELDKLFGPDVLNK